MPVGELNPNSWSGIKALYHLEDVNDSSGNGKTLINDTGVTFVPGKFNNGATDNASTMNLRRLTDDLGIAGNANLSISLWVKFTTAPASGSAYPMAIHRSQSGANKYFILYYGNAAGTLQLRLDMANNQTNYNITLDLNRWYHIVATRTGTSSCELYLNGTDTKIASIAQGAGNANNDDFWIGGDGGASSFDGVIDEVAVVAGVLTAKQIKDYYSWATGRMAKII